MRLRQLLFILLLLSPSLGFTQGIRYSNSVNSPTPTIRVCTEPATGSPCTPTASIYQDVGLTIPLSNPFTGDALGNFAFFASVGTYHAQISGLGITTFDIPYISLVSPFTTTINTVTFSQTPAFSAAANTVLKITLTADVTSSTITGSTAGQQMGFIVCQDGVGGHGFVWPTNFAGPPGVIATASFCTNGWFVYDGTAWQTLAVNNAANTITGAKVLQFNQASPATTWTINHNFGVQSVQTFFFDSGWRQIFPDSVTNTSINTVTATFLQAQAGFATVMDAGQFTATQLNPNVVSQNPTSSQVIAGGFSLTNSGSFTNVGNVTVAGTTTLPLLNCKNLDGSIFCIDTANTQGWAGSDPGAWFNSAITALPASAQLLVASGQYAVATPVTGAQDATILCPGGGSMGAGAASLNFTPATGNLITWSNSALQLIGCNLKTTTSTTSVAVKLIQASYTTNIERNHIKGFFGGLSVTGDGVSTYSTGVHITNNLIDNINANCAGSAGYGVSLDHARDITYDKNQVYSTTDCATGIPMILDTGVGGLWMNESTFEQGLHAGVIRNTNQGGAYGGAPAAIFADTITWDLSPGGDALLLDSSLGAADIRFFCTTCWAAGAGKNTLGAVVTPGAIGFNVQGGSNVHFMGGTSRVNASWGALAGTAGTNISFENLNVHANNQGNTAGVGGIKIAGPTGWRVQGGRSGNIIESGGNQAWGLDISGASTNGVLSGIDLRNNTSGRINYPAGIAQAGVDAPEFGSGTGLHFYGPTMWLNQAAPSGVAGEVVCYGDSSVFTLKCSYNNGSFFSQTQTIASGIAVMTTAAITAGNCGTTVTVGATGVAASDRIAWSFNTAPAGSNAGIVSWPTANNVNFAYCPNSAETPAAATINWQVTR